MCIVLALIRCSVTWLDAFWRLLLGTVPGVLEAASGDGSWSCTDWQLMRGHVIHQNKVRIIPTSEIILCNAPDS